MLIPIYMTTRDASGRDIPKESFRRHFHDDEPHADEDVACMAWPEVPDRDDKDIVTTRADTLHRLFNFVHDPDAWQAASLLLWNRTVPEFMAERALVVELPCADFVGAWRSINDGSEVSKHGVNSYWQVREAMSRGSGRARAFLTAGLPDMIGRIEAAIAEYESGRNGRERDEGRRSPC